MEIVRKKGIDLVHDPLFNKVYACTSQLPMVEGIKSSPYLIGLWSPKCLLQEYGRAYLEPANSQLLQGTAFPVPERERLELRGLLPKKCLTMQAQVSSASQLLISSYSAT